MHNLAIALSQLGHQVTGSDDEIFEPSLSRLQQHGLLPVAMGWQPSAINTGLDYVILGMHARADNPEYLRAKELELEILSYPDLIFHLSENKQRIVVAGSHGKTTITSMIMHVLEAAGKSFDYLVGSIVPGFPVSVRLSDQSPIIVIEGDEYLTSPVDRVPKFLKYKHHIGVVSGVAWDHVNVFTTYDQYVRQFDHFADATPKGGTLIYNEEDTVASVICKKERTDVTTEEYGTHPYAIKEGKFFLKTDAGELELLVFGKHNMQNIGAAKRVCMHLGITEAVFYSGIATYKGAQNRLQVLKQNATSILIKDFAHAPSKVRATVESVKELYMKSKVIAVLELHTFSSLNKAFLHNYAGALDKADVAIVYFNPAVVAHKALPALSIQDVKDAFNRSSVHVFTDSAEVMRLVEQEKTAQSALLFMSSGNFDGIDLNSINL